VRHANSTRSKFISQHRSCRPSRSLGPSLFGGWTSWVHSQGVYRYLYVAIDKFTKWAEVEPVRTIPAKSAVKFICGLVRRFGVPNRIITDNGSQFTSGLFREYCASVGIKIHFASVAHPRSNGQAERANAEVLKGLKTRSFNSKLKACGKNG
jgi:transposase InsO family protein